MENNIKNLNLEKKAKVVPSKTENYTINIKDLNKQRPKQKNKNFRRGI